MGNAETDSKHWQHGTVNSWFLNLDLSQQGWGCLIKSAHNSLIWESGCRKMWCFKSYTLPNPISKDSKSLGIELENKFGNVLDLIFDFELQAMSGWKYRSKTVWLSDL